MAHLKDIQRQFSARPTRLGIQFPLQTSHHEEEVSAFLDAAQAARRGNLQACSVLIAGFPCIGKTSLARTSPVLSRRRGEEQREHRVIDLDSSYYKLPGGGGTDFQRYLDDIEVAARLAEDAIVLVSCHETTRGEMARRGLEYVRVCPDPALKAEWVGRSAARDLSATGATGPLTRLLDGSWAQLTEMAGNKDGDASHRFLLKSGEFLSSTYQEVLERFGRFSSRESSCK